MQEKVTWQIRIAPSLGGGFDGTPEEVWGVSYYPQADFDGCIFFGLYGLPDFLALHKHKGRKAILWCGSDIQHFLNGYWLDDEGKMRIHPTQLSAWIDTYCENYVENEVEQQALRTVGIRSKVVPSFLGDVTKYEVSYQHSERPKVYTSVSGDNFLLYGWHKIPLLAHKNPNIEFHCYGNETVPDWIIPGNVIFHGRVPKEQMNEEIKNMQGCLRLTEFDGFSEIVAKAYLMGQQVFSIIPYPHSFTPDHIGELKEMIEPNLAGREWLLSVVNKYPWNIYENN